MKTPTISDIKYMKFFGQTMRDFRVRKSPKGRIFIFAKGKHNTYSFRQYTPSNKVGHGQLRNLPGNQNTLRDIEAYISKH